MILSQTSNVTKNKNHGNFNLQNQHKPA